MKTKMITKSYFNAISTTVLIVLMAISAVLFYFETISHIGLVIMLILSILISSSIQIADQWEKAVVLRMGKYRGLKGPGIFLIIPIIEKIINYVDQRIRVTDFKAEQTLTKDTVPVNVVAVLYWTVWDVEKAALEVQDYSEAIEYVAQTGLRDIIGRHELAELLQDREKIAKDLQLYLDEISNPWGITCQNVGIKDITIPQALADAMSKQAQAERERRARVILGTAETEIAEKFAKASLEYLNNPVALQLRAMNLIGEGLKEKSSLIIVPSTALDSMNLGVLGGLSSLGKLQMKDDLPPKQENNSDI
ncbi:MAG TPA: slipin family protein [Bacteroidales bacterium]|jgi:regulator of protease activity HflC (stomatin/prohibitin superfamily)|nr:slipin family protein [Bacteroidales bacterium]